MRECGICGKELYGNFYVTVYRTNLCRKCKEKYYRGEIRINNPESNYIDNQDIQRQSGMRG